jgi:hypothetical protein
VTAAAIGRTRILPLALGFGTLVGAILAVEVLIRAGAINRFIVPLPSQIAMAFERVIVEEEIWERFRLTFFEAFAAGTMITIAGVSLGILLYRVDLLRRATETWVAAMASAGARCSMACPVTASPMRARCRNCSRGRRSSGASIFRPSRVISQPLTCQAAKRWSKACSKCCLAKK